MEAINKGAFLRSKGVVKLILAMMAAIAFWASAALAEGSLPPIRVGSYDTTNKRVTHVTVNAWADVYEMKGNFIYWDEGGKEYRFPFQVVLNPGSNFYFGRGQFLVNYEGQICGFPVELAVYPRTGTDELFIRHFSPRLVPLIIQPGQCQPGQDYRWLTESAPYKWSGPLAKNWNQQKLSPIRGRSRWLGRPQ